MKINLQPTALKKVISPLEADHTDEVERSKRLVNELKAMWVKQDRHVSQILEASGGAIYTSGVYYTPVQTQKHLARLLGPSQGPKKGGVQKVRGVSNDV